MMTRTTGGSGRAASAVPSRLASRREAFHLATTKLLLAATLGFLVTMARLHGALVSESYSFNNVNLPIPDGNASGASDVRTISSEIASISSVSVTLGLSSTFNGDFYVYLRHDSGLSILLNRAGRTSGNPYGYDDSGFNVTFQDSAANGDVHLYQNVFTPAGGAALTGIWQPDARAVDPGSVTEASGRTAYLSSFNGLSASGTWTLFAADLQSGQVGAINNWSMDLNGVSAVPEPVNVTLAFFAVIFIGLAAVRHFRGKRKRPNFEPCLAGWLANRIANDRVSVWSSAFTRFGPPKGGTPNLGCQPTG